MKPELRREFRAKSENQSNFIRAIVEHDIVFGVGPAGAGKTAICVAMALQYLKESKVDKIIIVRPTIGSDSDGIDQGVGFLKGDLMEKMMPFMAGIFEEFQTYMKKTELMDLINDGIIDITPAYYCRGRNYHSAFVILEDSQNFSYNQLKALITRLGSKSKMVINGDINQTDRGKRSGLEDWLAIIGEDDEIPICHLEKSDIVRHPLLKKILLKAEKYEEENKTEDTRSYRS